MAVVVEDFLKRGVLSALDPETGELVEAPAGAERTDAKGAYMTLGRELAVFYADGGDLVLRIGRDTARLSGAKVQIEGDGLRRLTVARDGDELLTHQYPNPVNPPMEYDPTLAEEEDFDLGLFAANVHSEEKRRRFQLRKWGA